MTVHTLQVTGTRGELSPLMHARADIDFYKAGWKRALNMLVTRHGPMTRVPGTIHLGKPKFPDKETRLLPFEFNEQQVYALEFGHLYIRFWTRNGFVSATPPTPYEIATPFTEDMIASIRVLQSADVLYIFSDSLAPRKLTRRGETDWALEIFVPKDGPYGDLNATNNRVTLASTGHATPLMTSNTAPSGEVKATNMTATAYLMFNRSKTDQYAVSAVGNGQLSYTFPVGVAKVIDNYWLTSGSTNHYSSSMPRQWFFQGSDDETFWVTLDSRDGEDGWSGSETRFYEFENKTAFRFYRWLFSGGGGDDTSRVNSLAGELAMHESGDTMTPFRATFLSTLGINKDAGFNSGDVGRSIRVRGADAKWRWLRITNVVSATEVDVVLYGYALPDTSPIAAFRIGLWSDHAGWPRFGTFYQDRLVMSGADADPLGVSFSAIGGYDQFGLSDPIADDDAVTIRLTGGKMSRALWFAEAGALLIGTGASLRSVSVMDRNAALKNDNIAQKAEANVQASPVEPVVSGSAVLFVSGSGRRIVEAAYSYEGDGYEARELSVLNEHLFNAGIVQLTWLDAPHKALICRLADGTVVFFAYDRDQKIAGGTPADFQGFVEDTTALIGPTGTDIFMVVDRSLDGTDRRIELMAPFWNSEDSSADDPPVYVAAAYRYDGAMTGTLTGATWLAGQEVGVWADGRDIGDVQVDGSGAFALPFGIEAQRVVAGLRMPWQLETLRLTNYGQQDGAALGRSIIAGGATVDFLDSAGVSVGTDSVMDDFVFEDEAEDDPDAPTQLRTGAYVAPLDDSWIDGGVLKLGGDKLYPVTVRAISLLVEGEP